MFFDSIYKILLLRMETNLLKIDLDIPMRKDCIKLLQERLAYLNDLGALPIEHIKSITLVKKTRIGCKIYLHVHLKAEMIIMLQLILGSDYKKEVNTILNHFVLGMEYSNRLFDIKQYKCGKIMGASKYDATKLVKDYVLDKNRIKSNR